MSFAPVVLALLGALEAARPAFPPPTPLRVLRVAPSGTAHPASTIAITFDRPVAGSLDRSVDASRIVRVEPAVAARIQWRDPVTIVITPTGVLRSATRYTVTVATTFRAMDGSRLAEPHRFSFRVTGPRLLAGSPINRDEHPRYLTPQSRLELVWSAPVDLAKLSEAAYLQFNQLCAGERVVRLRATAQRRVTTNDPWQYRAPERQERGEREAERLAADRRQRADSLRRVVQLAPQAPLPLGCAGELVAPVEAAEGRTGTVRWPFNTYGAFRVAEVRCAESDFCPTGSVVINFSTPVRGTEVARRVKLLPETPFALRDSAGRSDAWVLDARLKPRQTYAVVVDTAIRDVFGQRLTGNPAGAVRTTGYAPSITYAYGRLLVERKGFGTLAVQHINLDTLVVVMAPVPDSLEGRFLMRSEYNLGDLWDAVLPAATTRRLPVKRAEDRTVITGIKLPPAEARRGGGTLVAVKVTPPRPDTAQDAPIALVQVTDLAVHAKIGAEAGVVWVTGVSDGRPRAGASVALHDGSGRRIATGRTDAQGLAVLHGYVAQGDTSAGDEDDGEGSSSFRGYVVATHASDRALVGIRDYDPDLSPWQFNVSAASDDERVPAAGAVFTERGIYRPGEELFAKAIVRSGPLGALDVPVATDSLRWLFSDKENGTLKDTTVAISAFGTADYVFRLPQTMPLGYYSLAVQGKRRGRWVSLASTGYRVAEYRPPEFLVDIAADSSARYAGDSMRVVVQGRYLFGAPMGRAAMTWQARLTPISGWALGIGNAEGYYIGENAWGWDEEGGRDEGPTTIASGEDTLDATGQRTLRIALGEPGRGRPAHATVSVAVVDVNRQAVGASASAVVHPAAFYVGAKPQGTSYFWTAGTPQSIGVVALRPNGARVTAVAVRAAVVRREWHQVHREREGVAEVVGEWVSDTVARCALMTAPEPVTCAFTPQKGGAYVVTLRAADAEGRPVLTTFSRWATGKEWVPWSDESRFKMDVIADKERYAVGDTATVLLASPFTDAEAWITVEREGIIEQRRMRLRSGSTTLKVPLTEAHVPNAYVSVLVARGRSAPPGKLDDVGRPTIRVGYAELRVTPEVKRLAVQVEPAAPEYRPGDTARVRLRVRDARGRGQPSEVTLWAVDEGVLALTGYTTPDPLDLIYQPRGLGLRLASNLASVAPQIPEGEKGQREPGGGGGLDNPDILRSRFKTTAFFIGSVVTDAQGVAQATAKLPDNLTTFRVMAVAVTRGDRYGSGQSTLLVTRPLVARPALPRIVRAGDEFTAGTVVNQRAGGTPTVRVEAAASGVQLRGDATQSARLEAGRGREVRFPFRAPARLWAYGDSATFRFGASSGRDADAVQTRIPIKPDHHPRAHTISGVLHDTATAEFVLPGDIDAARSRVELSLGASPLAVIRGAYGRLRIYPYYCTEQLTSAGMPLIALFRAQQEVGGGTRPALDVRREIERGVAILASRQRADGGIGYWRNTDWSTPWLSAYAGGFLLDAKSLGVAVDDSLIARLAAYLAQSLSEQQPMLTPVAAWYNERRTRMSDQVAAVNFLSRVGRPNVAAENRLHAAAAQMALEDRVLLAEVMARRGARQQALQLMTPVWSTVRVEGRRATLPDSGRFDFYFRSRLRPAARLLVATLAIDSAHRLIGPLVETLVQQARAEQGWSPNTQDDGSLVAALAEFERRQRRAGERGVRVRAGGRVLFESGGARAAGDSVIVLSGLLADRPDRTKSLRLSLDTPAGSGVAYYYLTVHEVPVQRPVTPQEDGIGVERWYERFDTKAPTTSVAEGELVRVRLRITVPVERQFVVLDDALPAGLEAVDLSLRTATDLPGPGQSRPDTVATEERGEDSHWYYGSWDAGWWSPFDYKEIRDDRVVYFATVLWPGTYTASYVARATTPGVFVRPPAHAEEMYNPGVNGRSDGGVFTVTAKR